MATGRLAIGDLVCRNTPIVLVQICIAAPFDCSFT